VRFVSKARHGGRAAGREAAHRASIADAETAYEGVGGAEPSIGILLEYPSREEMPDEELLERTVRLSPPATRPDTDVRVGFIGSGN
jgi:hypothetical protein